MNYIFFTIALVLNLFTYTYGQYMMAPTPPKYSIVNQPGASLIQIIITGITVKALSSINKQGSVNWDTRGMAAGVYLYEAGCERGIIGNGKLVVMP